MTDAIDLFLQLVGSGIDYDKAAWQVKQHFMMPADRYDDFLDAIDGLDY